MYRQTRAKALYIEFDQNGNSLPIGSYTATVLYYLNSSPTYENGGVLTGGTAIGLSPFTFKIETPQVLSQEIAQNPQSVSLMFVLVLVVILTVLANAVSFGVTYYALKTTTKRKRIAFFGKLDAALMLSFNVIGLIIAYLTLIK